MLRRTPACSLLSILAAAETLYQLRNGPISARDFRLRRSRTFPSVNLAPFSSLLRSAGVCTRYQQLGWVPRSSPAHSPSKRTSCKARQQLWASPCSTFQQRTLLVGD